MSSDSWSREEQEEWENVNKLLRHHGLRPLVTDKIVMDRQSSQEIRYALTTLVEETERQRKIVRGLIEDNRQLRDELRLERSRASRQEQRANDLDIILENIKHKIRQLEDESIANASQQHNQVKELQKDQQATQSKYNQLSEKLREREETIAYLEKELSRISTEEHQRLTRQKKMLRQFCKQAPRTHLDQQICSLIDSYESQINQIRKELSKYKRSPNHTEGRKEEEEEEFLKNTDATANYKALLMSFQTQIIETKARNEQLLHENIHLKKEIEIRPTVQELRFYKHQVKKLEKTLKNIKPHENTEEENTKENRELTCNTGGDQLQEVSRKYLQNLHRSLKKLLLRLVPWHTVALQDNNEHVRVEDLQCLVDEISEEVDNAEKKNSVPSQHALYAIVSHFQKLFDVKSLNGIYPRMNEVYSKLGEMTNAMRNLRDLLELDASTPPSVLVNTVGKLCSLFNKDVTKQIEQLLGTQDIESIIYKLEEHDHFFPAFQALTEELLRILEVTNPTDIVPAVQRLKGKVQ
ncbi:centrosomal protein of 70 kDa isoform X3 [Anolis sagrei]|uniref:centrosomal protein of 70 kDa isoform X3 n=1 Tax=Anolis sagrei TaxID=38937 RepID=UPI00351FB93F